MTASQTWEPWGPGPDSPVTGTGSISVFTKPVAPAGDYVWSGETSADMAAAAERQPDLILPSVKELHDALR